MKTTPKAIIALAILVPTASCADADTSSSATADETAAREDFQVYSDGSLQLDCPQGFEALQSEAIAIDGMELVTETDEQIAYMSGPVSFALTKEGHFAHPMIVRRDVIVDDPEDLSISMAGCGYGAKEAFDKTMERFTLLNERFLLQQKIQIKDETGSGSEIVDEEEAPESEGQE